MKMPPFLDQVFITFFSSLGAIGIAYAFTKLFSSYFGFQEFHSSIIPNNYEDFDIVTLSIFIISSILFVTALQFVVSTQVKRLANVYQYLAAGKVLKEVGVPISVMNYMIYFGTEGDNTTALIFVCSFSLILSMLVRVSSGGGKDEMKVTEMLMAQQLCIICHVVFQNYSVSRLVFSVVTLLVTLFNGYRMSC